MGILPKTDKDWLRLGLLPFKAYAVMAYPATSLTYSLISRHRGDTDVGLVIFSGYLWCALILFFCAFGWWSAGERRQAAITFVFTGVAVLLGFASMRFLVA